MSSVARVPSGGIDSSVAGCWCPPTNSRTDRLISSRHFSACPSARMAIGGWPCASCSRSRSRASSTATRGCSRRSSAHSSSVGIDFDSRYRRRLSCNTTAGRYGVGCDEKYASDLKSAMSLTGQLDETTALRIDAACQALFSFDHAIMYINPVYRWLHTTCVAMVSSTMIMAGQTITARQSARRSSPPTCEACMLGERHCLYATGSACLPVPAACRVQYNCYEVGPYCQSGYSEHGDALCALAAADTLRGVQRPHCSLLLIYYATTPTHT